MDVFKFNNPTNATLMQQGVFLNGLKSILWIERYRDAGEFKLVASADSDIRKQLPIGSFISHTKTSEVMVVENHVISDDKDKESEITITGRSFETILDNRIIGANQTFPVSGTLTDYSLVASYIADQVVYLINRHVTTTYLINDDDAILYVTPSTTSIPGANISRLIKRGSLYARILELLEIENLGIKVSRPGPWSPNLGSINLYIVIHKGVDRSKTVSFSYDSGEIENADYLWSNKNLKNACLVTGKWVETVVLPTATTYNRRMMHISATDIDEAQTVAPTGAALTMIVAAMQQRGLEALAAQNDITLTKAEVSKESIKYVYRTDYNVGDLVTVTGDYNENTTMRVSEFVEIEDETGESEYPTLTLEEI
jgi:hypothetical protein